MSTSDVLRAKLEARFQPIKLEIVDESDRHAGHAGARAGGETHFRVLMVSPVFAGMNRVARQRLVYAVLDDELRDSVHALSLNALAPDELQD